MATEFVRALTGGDRGSHPCLFDDSSADWTSFDALRMRISAQHEALAQARSLVFLYPVNDIGGVAMLLAAIAAGHAVALFDPLLAAPLREELEARFAPGIVIDGAQDYAVTRRANAVTAIHPDVMLLLSTSGSTGSPKLVRLTAANLLSNARAISDTLSIAESDVAAGHLPLHYSFGLSVLTSHLVRGARVRLTATGLTDRAFWQAMRDAGITHMPGVPFHFQMMERLGYQRLALPTLVSLAQAGGSLDLAARARAHQFMGERSGRFYVMYGQTEAGPRISTLGHDQFDAAPGSVGHPLPGGRIEILDADDTGQGEVVYSGPNVMMGYAESSADLALPDLLKGRLETGDIGRLDGAGRLTLTGRAKRTGKIFGLRVNLDEVERATNEHCESAVVSANDRLMIFHAHGDDAATGELQAAALLADLRARFTLPPLAYRFHAIAAVPRTDRGKIDYAALDHLS